MKVLLVTHGTWLDPCAVVSGNSVRAYWLARGLSEQDIEVVHCHPAGLGAVQNPNPLPGVRVCAYEDRAELSARIQAEAPTVLLVGYWELLEELPERLDLPVVVDLVAPRVLEVMYEDESRLPQEIARMLRLYRRADRFVVGNRRQRHFLLPWLMLAGFDLKAGIPVDVVPISTEPGTALSPNPEKRHWRYVSGGVNWPWRRTAPYFNALVRALERLPEGVLGELTLFAGNYVYGGSWGCERLVESERIQRKPLAPYGAMRRFLREHGDIGVELSEHNVERELSQAFRAVECLSAGLPLLISSYTELAEQVRIFDAGWVVDSPDGLSELVRAIAADPASWARKSQNAVRLVAELLDYRRTVEPLLDYVRAPKRAPPGPPRVSPALAPVPAEPSSRFRTASVGLLKRKLFGAARRLKSRLAKRDESALIMVTRSDIFPVDHGAAVKIDRTAWGLSLTGLTVLLVSDERHRYYVYRNGVRTERSFPFWLRLLAPPMQLVQQKLARKGLPVGDAFLFYPLVDWSFVLRVFYLAASHSVLAFQAEFPAYARPALWARSLFGGKVLLVEHNIEYQRLADQFPHLDASIRRYLHKVEVQLCCRADAVIVVSERDRATLAAAGVPNAQIHHVPHGVDLAAFDAAEPEDVRGRYGISIERPVLVYHGIYGYPPNLEAMQVMAQDIMPRLHRRGVDPVVLAIGRCPPRESLHPDLIFTGSVDRVAPFLRAADVAVVPLLRGGGTRMKILDYFAARVPVVSTAKGIEGIPVTPGLEALVENDYDAFADAVVGLLRDRERARAIAQRARALVDGLDWVTIARRYREILGV